MITTDERYRDYEERGTGEFQFVMVTYTGDRSSRVNRDLRERAGFAGSVYLQRDQPVFAILPDWWDSEAIDHNRLTVSALEGMGDFEVTYDPEEMARVLLEKNYLPPNAFRAGYDDWVRDKLFEALGLEERGRVDDNDDEEKYREQLRDLIGVEVEEVPEDRNRRDEYDDRFSRSQLGVLCKHLREDSDELDLRSAGRTDMIDFLMDFEPDEVESAVQEIEG